MIEDFKEEQASSPWMECLKLVLERVMSYNVVLTKVKRKKNHKNQYVVWNEKTFWLKSSYKLVHIMKMLKQFCWKHIKDSLRFCKNIVGPM